MAREGYFILDSDLHLMEPYDLWERYLEGPYKVNPPHFFAAHRRIHHALALLQDVGLGYLTLGQQSPTLSGGEAQRIKLVTELAKLPKSRVRSDFQPARGKTLYVLDEPTVGLHMADVEKLIRVLHRLVDAGNTVVVIEHNLDVIADADWIVDLGPEGGAGGGRIIAQGTPHEVLSAPRGETVAQLAGFENIFDAQVTAIHEERGTMTCRVGSTRFETAQVEIETPLVHAVQDAKLRVGISAGDVLLATSVPVGLSARNILPGRLLSLAQRDMIIVARVDCGVELSVHLTLGARDSLELVPGRQVWVIMKTHSCHLLAE